MRAIFLSYRRDDAEGDAGRLFDALKSEFGVDKVFMDVRGIPPGQDFRRFIEHKVASCGVLLAMIGRGWIDASDRAGCRRLDDPLDFVRLETAAALKRDIPVIPVLVGGGRMPRPDQLPEDLKDLAYRHAVELTNARWDSDVQLLIKAVRPSVGPRMMVGHWAVRDEDGIHRVHAEIIWDFPRMLSITWDSIMVESLNVGLVAGDLRSFQCSGHSFKLSDRGLGILGKLVLFMDGVEVPRMEDSEKEAKKLLRDLRKRDAAALRRYQAIESGDPMPEPSLVDAQHVIAREQGFANWRELMEYLN